MAVVCAKCGAEVPAGVQFCSACGAPVNPGAPSSAPTAGSAYTPVNVPGQAASASQSTAGAPPLPGYTPVAAVPAGYAPAAPAKNNSALKVILIIVAVLVGLSVLGAGAVGFMVWRVAHAFHVHGKDGQITVNTPSGSVTASGATNFTADELGTDIYPGAQSVRGGMRMNLPTGSIMSGVFVTSDSKDQVLAFYKNRLGSSASVFDSDQSSMLTLKKGSHENIMITISVRPTEENGKTKISIVHTTNNRPS